jgi:hypothetical protein
MWSCAAPLDLDDGAVPILAFAQDTAHLREAGGRELIAAYAAVPPALRKVVLKLVLEIAKSRSTPLTS